MPTLQTDYLVIPMMADFTSLEGIKGIFMLLYGQYPSESLKKYASNIITFNKQVEQFELKLPKVQQFVFNNYTINRGIASAYGSIKDELIRFCYEQYNSFHKYFSTNHRYTNINFDKWKDFYVSDVKDFHSSGKVSASLGIPLYKLPDQGEKFTMPDGTQVTVAKHRYNQAVENIEKLTLKF